MIQHIPCEWGKIIKSIKNLDSTLYNRKYNISSLITRLFIIIYTYDFALYSIMCPVSVDINEVFVHSSKDIVFVHFLNL
jgi:hypothetical protein